MIATSGKHWPVIPMCSAAPGKAAQSSSSLTNTRQAAFRNIAQNHASEWIEEGQMVKPNRTHQSFRSSGITSQASG
jgi:hypothetical protein